MTVYIPIPNEMLLVFCEIGWIPSDKLILSSSLIPSFIWCLLL